MVGNLIHRKYGVRAGYDEILVIGDSNTLYGKGRNGADEHVQGYDPLIDVSHPKVFQRKRDGTTVLALDPFDYINGPYADQPISFALPFGRDAYVPGGSLGDDRLLRITHAGVGGSGIATGSAPYYWQTGGGGFNAAVSRINAAIAENPAVNTLKAVLWCGGANDAVAGISQATFLAGILDMIAGLRTQLTGGATVPIAVSGIVRVMVSVPAYAAIDNALRDVPNNAANTVYVNTDTLLGFPEGAGGFHYCNTAHRLLGPAYYNAILPYL